MRWSKLRTLVRERLADSVADRVDIHSARYGACGCGHAWITLDGKVIANFCTRAKYVALGLEPGKPNRKQIYALADFGEFSRQDAYEACWAFVHELSAEQALGDEDPLVQSLAMLDRRVGKRRLRALDEASLHPLARRLLLIRLEAEQGAPLTSASVA
ncbi:MAG TPA: hypothetical protein VGD10_13090 [Allosphingosinicella sp.]|uniref:SF0329 family protein n=1 Tax=Allosphingosinicella sp. TaxID=2823234 RepID=UPI002ED9DE44